MATLKLMPEYGCHPLWVDYGDGYFNISPNSLGLSTQLCADIIKWSEKYEYTLNMKYPPDSKFCTKEEEDSFEREGIRLFSCLSQELKTSYIVQYKKWKIGDIPRKRLIDGK